MECALMHFRLPIARLILSAKGDRPAADVFNHGGALYFCARSSEAVEWALDTCTAESPERPFGGLNLVYEGKPFLHHYAEWGIVSPRIAQLLRHQLTER